MVVMLLSSHQTLPVHSRREHEHPGEATLVDKLRRHAVLLIVPVNPINEPLAHRAQQRVKSICKVRSTCPWDKEGRGPGGSSPPPELVQGIVGPLCCPVNGRYLRGYVVSTITPVR